MWGIISTLAGAAVPWAGPRFTIALTGAVLVSSVCGLLFLSGMLYGGSGKREAVNAVNLEWKLKLSEAENAARIELSQQLEAATAAAAAILPVPSGDLARLCGTDARCTDRRAAARK